MIDPKNYISDAAKGLERIVQDAFHDGYVFGYARGDADAIARIIQAAKPGSNGRGAPRPTRTQRPQVPKGPGAATHKLIQTVLHEAGSTGASPIEIARSPANKHEAGRSGIGKILRRGVKQGQFHAVGDGRYALGKTGAAK